MNTFEAVMIAEGVQDPDSEEQYLEAWTELIETGVAWELQGWFGRRADELIYEGFIDQPAVYRETSTS